MFVGFPSIDQLGGWPESRNSKSAFGGDGLRNAQNSTCCGIRDFETTHLTQNIFFGSGSWKIIFLGSSIFRGFSRFRRSGARPASSGQIWGRPASSQGGFRWIFNSPGSKNLKISLISIDFYWFSLISIDFHWFPLICNDFISFHWLWLIFIYPFPCL